VERFEGVVEAAGGGGHLVEIPLDVAAVFGARRPPVRGTVNGAPFRSTVAVELERDDEPRTVELPDDLRAALDERRVAFFESLSFTHQREYVRWIEEAKREETRRRRIERAAELLRDGVRTPDG
jgi:hypothetical protein